ncbi:hypothetical protein DXG03_008093 [Asterophora parasitica]|uniref:Uncharacterized protein n=1 Tax=Asterophora parasitica TaxID=117018 RepID=A0A9P7G8A7_9AGAR|nr:hypothetical protein DXG03_008093 [Asterophora parasitica]
MAALSATTVILSLRDGCPGLAFFILEVIINASMIIEVAIRFIAFGKPKPIDISSARQAGFMDLDIDTDDEGDELHRPLVRNPILFDIHGVNEEREAFTDTPGATETARDRDTEDTWARLG